MKKMLVANWKLNPENVDLAVALAKLEDKKQVIICPPTPYLSAVGNVIKRAKLGAQDAFWEKEGPYTGNTSPTHIKSVGAKYVILGHSERRNILQEGDDAINQKVEASLKSGLQVILCIGEDLDSHQRGEKQTKLFITDQIIRGFKNIKWKDLRNIAIAYEPVWAISTSGSGLKDAPEESIKIIQFIKDFLRERYMLKKPVVLYGGTINSKNAENYLINDLIDGVLIGGASLDAKEFNKIIKICLER